MIDTVELNLIRHGYFGGMRLESNYSLKFQNFISREYFQTIVDDVKEICSKYTTLVISAASLFIFGTLIGMISSILIKSFSIFSYGPAFPILVISLWALCALLVLRRRAYRVKKMKEYCAKLTRDLPGSNWVFRVKGRGNFTTYHVEVEIPRNINSATAPNMVQSMNSLNVADANNGVNPADNVAKPFIGSGANDDYHSLV
eukprot:TRINITY_DN1183_c0_g1_i1.p1 TRINITY_DN1183_c0_g1~~TRINITY_DN1183_c0_g1_i1.p1  ORF type:complete len:201 (+),score=17.41 TRINITY_DN1183_c0_g1_i1:79-681(+)